MKRIPYKEIIRLCVGIGLLTLLLYQVNLVELTNTIKDINVTWFVVMLITPHLAILVSVIKWKLLLASIGCRATILNLMRLYMIGTFFNNFLPSMIGGDIVRTYMLGKEENDSAGVTAATFMERLTGLAALVSLLLLVFFDDVIVARYPWLLYIAAAIVAAFWFLVLLLLRRKKLPYQDKMIAALPKNKVTDFIARTKDRTTIFYSHIPTVIICFALSFLYYAIAMFTVYAAVNAIGQVLDTWVIIVVVPMVLFVGLLPISINGMGVNETSWAILFNLYGMAVVYAVAIGLLLRFRILLSSLLGGLIYLFVRRKLPETKEMNNSDRV